MAVKTKVKQAARCSYRVLKKDVSVEMEREKDDFSTVQFIPLKVWAHLDIFEIHILATRGSSECGIRTRFFGCSLDPVSRSAQH